MKKFLFIAGFCLLCASAQAKIGIVGDWQGSLTSYNSNSRGRAPIVKNCELSIATDGTKVTLQDVSHCFAIGHSFDIGGSGQLSLGKQIIGSFKPWELIQDRYPLPIEVKIRSAAGDTLEYYERVCSDGGTAVCSWLFGIMVRK